MATGANPLPRTGRTRGALAAAGFELLAERPVDAIAIDEIVARAGVAKGSFFNHFADKHAFAAALAAEVRGEVEAQLARIHAGLTQPVERIAARMAVGARMAVDEPRRMMVLLRAQGLDIASAAHPLHRGLREDIEAALAARLLRPEARALGVTYWLGLCQVLMQELIAQRPPRALAARQLRDMVVLGLTGLGVTGVRAEAAARVVLSRGFAAG